MATLSLIVIRCRELERARLFYERLGLEFVRHRHGAGPEHLACEKSALVFELYPRRSENDDTTAVRLGFRVREIEEIIGDLERGGIPLLSPLAESPWGRRAVVADPDGHTVELIEATEGR
jgi:catechol 2,3-dioxygenase-like lactoylglutathione lyase family enzyme